MSDVSLTLLPENRKVRVPGDRSLKEALAFAGVLLRGTCRGAGTCGQCEVLIDGRPVLSCRETVEDGMTVVVPLKARIPSGMGSPSSGGLAQEALPQEALAHASLAVDVGTTTIVSALVHDGKEIARVTSYNPQIAYGDDVVGRIIYSEEEPDGLSLLRKLAVDQVNEHIAQFRRRFPGVLIRSIAVAGNLTMLSILLGRKLSAVRREEVPVEDLRPFCGSAGDIGICPGEADLYMFPGVAAFVGGDITAGVLATGLNKSGDLRLLLDLGTNGEMVLGNSDFMISCACSIGPAFEGSGIRWGMPAVPGAIYETDLDSATGQITGKTIGGKPAAGISGSGLISLVGLLTVHRVMDRTGRLNHLAPQVIRYTEDGRLAVPIGKTETGEQITVDQNDINNVLRAKAAAYAGITTLLTKTGVAIEDISQIMLAGGFGSGVSLDSAVDIGLLPDIPRSRYIVIGNSSLTGAMMCAERKECLEEARRIAESITYIDLSQDNQFMNEYTAALFIPHTELSRFTGARTAARE